MKKVLLISGLASLSISAYQLYMRQTKKAKDDTIADVAVFGIAGVALLILSK